MEEIITQIVSMHIDESDFTGQSCNLQFTIIDTDIVDFFS